MTERPVRFGYVPYSADLRNPGDRRRFPFWAERRGATWEVVRPGGAYDVIVLATTADLVRWSRRSRGPHVVYELIDSYLELPQRALKNRLRGLAKYASGELSRPVLSYHRAIEAMCRSADAVVCSTPEQRHRLSALNPNVHDILDAHEDLVRRRKTAYDVGPVANIVWEGLPYTLDDFEVVAPALRRIAGRRPIALHLVTDLRYQAYARRFRTRHTEDIARRILPDTYLYQWNERLLADIATACDVAVVPLDLDDPFAVAKPENKLLLLWRMALPVVTSATPAYRRAMAAAGLDLTCTTTSDWEEHLERLLDDGDRRANAGSTGARYVEREHSTEMTLRRWDALFASVLEGADARPDSG